MAYNAPYDGRDLGKPSTNHRRMSSYGLPAVYNKSMDLLDHNSDDSFDCTLEIEWQCCGGGGQGQAVRDQNRCLFATLKISLPARASRGLVHIIMVLCQLAFGAQGRGKRAGGAGRWSRFLAILRARAIVVTLRANSRSDIVERHPKARTLLKKRKREKREGELNSQHSTQGELAPSPTNDPSDDVPLTPRSTGISFLKSPSSPARASVATLRSNSRSDNVERQPNLLKKGRRDKREGELNSHSSLFQPASNPHSISDPSDDVPFTPRSMGTPALESPPPFNKNYPPSSFVSSSRPDSPISRPPSAASSTTTAPSYSGGSYQRVRSDTLASTQTYETLPSYCSRRNTQIFIDSGMPLSTTPRAKFRPLPPLPS
ncbi:hypothetical protein PQX77_001234, partial [Marasmius sp. AFHP31]